MPIATYTAVYFVPVHAFELPDGSRFHIKKHCEILLVSSHSGNECIYMYKCYV